jgi:hypothetical protein
MASNVTIDATGLGDRIFQVSTNARLTLENLTLKGGEAAAGNGLFASGQFGGAIYNSGTLVLENCVITNNTSGGGQSIEGNGGFTPTHALFWGSPAIDQGKCFGVHRDQRGRFRPYIYSSISKPPGGDGSDIGAFELETR